MGDVAAVVLTVGERTTERALDSVRRQTLQPEQVVVVEGARPFHRAFNSAFARVETPYFVQVDADMVLDPDCLEVLRGAMSPRTGIALGALRDPLIGKIAGVKMFRSSCLESFRLRDTIDPDVDYSRTLARLGWSTDYLTGHRRPAARSGALGAHLPDYTLPYVFGTYYALGRRYGHRVNLGTLRWRVAQLRRSPHPKAPVARLAMAKGVFGNETADIPKPRPGSDEAAFLRRLLATPRPRGIVPHSVARLLDLPPASLFEAFCELGASLRSASSAAFLSVMRLLAETDARSSHLAELAFGGGALVPLAPGAVRPAFERIAASLLDRPELERTA